MGDKSSIEWCDASWNPITGCTKVSAGCKNCYAERLFPRAYSKDVVPVNAAAGITDRDPDPARSEHFRRRQFTDVRTHPERLDAPLHWRKPRRIFVNSMSDLFHKDVPDEFLVQAFTVMGQLIHGFGSGRDERHTYQILTKRPKRMLEFMNRLSWKFSARGTGGDGPWRMPETGNRPLSPVATLDGSGDPTPAPHIWMGCSVEDQPTADERIPLLLQTPAAVRFVSAEPLLGHIDFTTRSFLDGYEEASITGNCEEWIPPLDWIIVGSESGPKARPMDIAWARSIVDQCAAAGVRCFVKQIANEHDRKGGIPDHWPGGHWPREFPR